MFQGNTRVRCLLVEDSSAVAVTMREMLDYAEIEAHPVATNRDAIVYLRQSLLGSYAIDVVTTDIIHPDGSGVDLIREIRSLSDDLLFPGGLRARHVPIVVLSGSLTDSTCEAIAAIDRKVPLIHKPFSSVALIQAVDSVLSEYRHAVLQELEEIGLAVAWQGGRYQILVAYRQKPERPVERPVEGRLFGGSPAAVAKGYGRLVLLADRTGVAERSIAEFETLLNDARTAEPDLQAFFERHPAFLRGHDFDSYWSQPTLGRSAKGVVRPDFVLQPRALRDLPWNWRLIELKHPQAPVVTGSHFHPGFSQRVNRGLTQLRDYSQFFADPRNATLLEERFGGVVPRPKLVLTIGRLPSKDMARLTSLREREPDVEITTYDEVLEFRRVQVGYLRSIGVGDHC